MGRFTDLTGLRFERLVVISKCKTVKAGKALWKCQCDCGKVVTVLADSLRKRATKSCGCLRIESAKKRATVHGYYYEKLHGVWNSMKQRCSNKNSKDFKFYGGRGIAVCADWVEYVNFRQWAMASGYEEGLTIDRIDVDGPYQPGNCKWIPLKEQMLNRRSNLVYKKE